MVKIEKCPKCNEVSPALTLRPTSFCLAEEKISDTREYVLVCLECGEVIETIVIDNTVVALRRLNEELNILYGPKQIEPAWIFL